MTDFFIGQISIFAFDFAPRFWAQCNGQLLPINQNQALFSLLGTQYGGNGTTNFALPDMRGRVPISQGNASFGNYSVGERAGAESVLLTTAELPAHTHPLNATTTVANRRPPAGRIFATDNASVAEYYAVPGAVVGLSNRSMPAAGGSQAHPNMQPYSVLNFCVALSGIFPSRA